MLSYCFTAQFNTNDTTLSQRVGVIDGLEADASQPLLVYS